MDQLGDDSSGQRPRTIAAPLRLRRAVAVAGHTGDAALVRAHLDDDDPDVRATAIGALARLGELSSSTLQHAFADPDPIVRRRAVELAAAWSGEASLVQLLDDSDASVVETTAWALGERPAEPGAVERLCALAIGHADALVREAAVAALGALGDPDGLPAILTATRDKPAVRRRAVLALAPFEGPEVDEALARAREDRDRQVRQAAEDLLAP